MQSKKFYAVEKTLNNVEMIDMVLTIFANTVLNERISLREITVLRDYLINGYNAQTKKALRLTLDITSQHLDQINHQLKKKGFLESHKNNERQKILNKKLLDLKGVFIDSEVDNKVFLINFKLKND
jgi:hypothetical protein